MRARGGRGRGLRINASARNAHTFCTAPCPRRSLKGFYFLAQDLRCLIFSLISLHFKIKPLG